MEVCLAAEETVEKTPFFSEFSLRATIKTGQKDLVIIPQSEKKKKKKVFNFWLRQHLCSETIHIL